MRLFQPVSTAPFFASLSFHGLHFVVYAPSRSVYGRSFCNSTTCGSLAFGWGGAGGSILCWQPDLVDCGISLCVVHGSIMRQIADPWFPDHARSKSSIMGCLASKLSQGKTCRPGRQRQKSNQLIWPNSPTQEPPPSPFWQLTRTMV